MSYGCDVHANGIPFLASVGTPICYRGCKAMDSATHKDCCKAPDKLFRMHNNAGFSIKTIECDGECRAMMDQACDGLGAKMNCANAQDHVPRAERNNRTTKDSFRTAFQRTGCKAMPVVMIRALGELCARRLNWFPAKQGMSEYCSPSVIMGEPATDCNKHCKHSFGDCVQATTENDPSNAPAERTIDAVCLSPNDNKQGGHRVMNLNTGKVVARTTCAAVPLAKAVRDKVEQMAKAQGITTIKFANKKGVELPNADWIAGVDYELEDNDNNENDDNNDDNEFAPTQQIGNNDTDLEHDDDVDEDEAEELQQDTNPTEAEAQQPEAETATEEQLQEDEHTDELMDEVLHDEQPTSDNNNNDEENNEDEAVEENDTTEVRRSSRTRTARTPHTPGESTTTTQQAARYCQAVKDIKTEQQHNMTHEESFHDVEHDDAEAMVLARAVNDMLHRCKTEQQHSQQHALEKGLKKFGNDGEEATVKEMKQSVDRECFKPMLPKDLSNKEISKAQRALMCLTEKRDKSTKGRCACNGKPTREWLGREETASPTAHLESICLTAVIDAYEGRDAMSADVPNAFVQTELRQEEFEERAAMKIAGVLVDILVNNDPDVCGGHVACENGRKALCAAALKAACGMLVSAMLWHKKFRKDSEGQDFVFNPCDPCAANKTANGCQQTIRFHADDVMSSHVDKKVNDDFEKWLNKMHGEHGEVKATRGNVHDCLGMTFAFNPEKGDVETDMADCTKGMAEDFPIKFNKKKKDGRPTTVAATEMFSEDNSKKLSEKEREAFHKFAAKGLFACKRARQDMQPIASALCTRVKNPGRNDWNKLVRMMKFLSETADDVLTLSAERGLHHAEWHTDASFAVHPDFKSHAGATQVFKGGRGTLQSASAKQKLNSSSSTASELTSVDHVLPMVLWTPLFLDSQGYPVETNAVCQDNKSTILLEKNGKKSSGKRTRALNIRHFMVTDCAERGAVQIVCCPTDKMLADRMTKGLQGVKFSQFRRRTMGMDPEPDMENIDKHGLLKQ